MAIPETIGRYRIEAELGHGAMGAVYRANDPLMDRTVAIKTILAGVLSGPQSTEYRERFTREARAAGRLTNPGIVTVYDVGEQDGVPYLVMEFVKGRTLAAAMEAGQRFSFERIYEIGYQVADALGFAHRNGVVHRDIKPANILLAEGASGEPERAKIADLGVAKLSASQITTTGQLLGTPAFMPPEQFTGAPLDGRADLFSLGVILYWLATGDKPFSGDTITAVSYKIVHSDPAMPRKINPAVPQALETIVMRCLEKDPARRYPTGEALASDLAAGHAGRELNQTFSGTAMRNTNIGGTIPVMAPVTHIDGDPNTTLDSDMRHLAADRAAHASAIEMSGIEQLKSDGSKSTNPASARNRRMAIAAGAFILLCILLAWAGIAHQRKSELARQMAAQIQAQIAKEMEAVSNSANTQTANPPTPAQTDQSQAVAPDQNQNAVTGSTPPSTSSPQVSTDQSASQPPDKPQPAKTAPATTKQQKSNQGKRGGATSQSSQPASDSQNSAAAITPASPAPPPVAPVDSQPAPAPAPANSQPSNNSALPPPVAKPTAAEAADASKIHVDDGHVPNSVSFVVLMDGKILAQRGAVTEGQLDPLKDDISITPGNHEFKVITAPNGIPVVQSNTVRQELKSKKKKTLRIELRDNSSGGSLKKQSKVDPNTSQFNIELRDSGIFGIR
jgi:serine/threonine-protein kinase